VSIRHGEAAYFRRRRLSMYKRGTRVRSAPTGKLNLATIVAGEKQVMEKILEAL